jgi:hypothetical protein
MKLGSNNISSIYLGINAVQSVYLGTNLVWSGVDPDYQAVLDYATLQGYTLPSAGQQALQNQLVVDLKAAGVWSKLDTFAVFATDGNSNFALIDWKRLIQYTAVNSPTFTTNQGFNGNGSSSYINTNYNATTQGVNYSLNSASNGAYLFENSLGDFCYLGALELPNKFSALVINRATNLTRMNDSTNGFPTTKITTTGLICANRPNSTTLNIYKNGTFHESIAATSTGLPNTNFYALAWSVGGTPGQFTNKKVSCVFLGADLTSYQTDFNTALNNYMTAI